MRKAGDTALGDVFERLRTDRLVENQNDFALKTSYHPTPMSQMLQGVKPIPYKLLEQLYLLFGVNANYIISGGMGPIYARDIGDPVLSESEVEYGARIRVEVLQQEIDSLKRQLADKNKIISLLESRLSIP